MGATHYRPVGRIGNGRHSVRKDPGWQVKPGYRTPSKEELKRIREKELKKDENSASKKKLQKKECWKELLTGY